MRIGRSCCKEKKDTYKPEALIRDRVEEVTLLLFCFNMICTCQARIMLRDRSLFITEKGEGEGGGWGEWLERLWRCHNKIYEIFP